MNILQFNCYIFLFCSLVRANQLKAYIPKLDLWDPESKNNFKFHLINDNIEELNEATRIFLDENCDLIAENNTVNEFFDSCSIYKERSNNFSIFQNEESSFENILEYSLLKGLEIINNTTQTESIEHLLPKDINTDYLFPLDAFQGFMKSDKFSSSKWHKILDYKAPFWQYRLIHDVNFLQFSENLPTYLLGKSQTASILDDPSAQIKFHSEGYYISLTYGNGSLCDATNLPREVELQFVCDSNFDNDNYFYDKKIKNINFTEGSRILQVNEPYVCKYQVLIGVPGLCKVDLLRNRNIFDNDENGNYEVVCKRNQDYIFQTGKSFEKFYTWEFKEIPVGRDFIFMKNEDQSVSDYVIDANIITTIDEVDLRVLTDDFRHVFIQYIKPYLANMPRDFKLYHASEPKRANYEYDIEVYDLLGNYVFTLEVNLANYGIKVSNKRLSMDMSLVNKNFVKLLIPEDVESKEEESLKNLHLKEYENSKVPGILQVNNIPLKPIENIDFKPLEMGIDNDLAKSILEQMLRNLEQQENQ